MAARAARLRPHTRSDLPPGAAQPPRSISGGWSPRSRWRERPQPIDLALEHAGRSGVQYLRSKPPACRSIGQPLFDRTALLYPAVLSKQAVEPAGEHMDTVIRLAPAIGRIARDAESLADQLVQRLAHILV